MTPEQRERHNAASRKWNAANRTRVTEWQRKRRASDPLFRAVNAFEAATYRKANREKVLAAKKAARKARPWVHAAEEVARRAAKSHRTPAWADLGCIRRIYENCPAGHHVDHVIPLRGKTVSGLHVEYNLQYLPEKDNLRKGNRHG